MGIFLSHRPPSLFHLLSLSHFRDRCLHTSPNWLNSKFPPHSFCISSRPSSRYSSDSPSLLYRVRHHSFGYHAVHSLATADFNSVTASLQSIDSYQLANSFHHQSNSPP